MKHASLTAGALPADCIFTDWRGFLSPLQIWQGGRANVVDTVFRNMHLPVELADVSKNGYVRFANVSLANVILQQGRVVSTTYNDYRAWEAADGDAYIVYSADDDEGFDVELAPVAPGDAGMFGVQFIIEDSEMSDCVNLEYDLNEVLPGCPEAALQRRREFLELAMDPADVDNLFAETESYAPPRRPLLSASTPWLLQLRAALGPLPPPPPPWPPFTVTPPVNLTVREGIADPVPVPPGQLLTTRFGPAAPVNPALVNPPPTITLPPQSAWESPGVATVVGVLAALAAVGVVAAVVAAFFATVALRRLPPRPPQEVIDRRLSKRQLAWTSSGFTVQPVRIHSLRPALP